MAQHRPEHCFTDDQIAELTKLLGTHTDNLPTMQGEGLVYAARFFISSLVQQNYPPRSQIVESLGLIENETSRLRLRLSNPLTTPYMRRAAADIGEDDRKFDSAIVAVENLRRWSQRAQEDLGRIEALERRDEAEREAIGKAIAEADARGDRKATPEAIAEARANAKVTRRAKGKPKGHAKRTAMRVLIQRLALLWRHTHETGPTVSVMNNHASGKFIRFAQSYIRAMRKQTTDEHRDFAKSLNFSKSINKELDVSADAIAAHVKIYIPHLR